MTWAPVCCRTPEREYHLKAHAVPTLGDRLLPSDLVLVAVVAEGHDELAPGHALKNFRQLLHGERRALGHCDGRSHQEGFGFDQRIAIRYRGVS
jgi:hypothetical protein